VLRFDKDAFTKAYALSFPGEKTTGLAAQGLIGLLDVIEQDFNVQDVRWAAYMLATTKHECANTWTPITERGNLSYFDKYNAGTPLGARLGNTQPGDGFRFRGRGYVQLTGRANYLSLGRRLNMATQLVDDPELVLRPDIAYKIMSFGMRNGSFTGRKLQQFIYDTVSDYLNARKIINGLDRAQTIQGYAAGLERALNSALESSAAPVAPAKPAVPAAAPGVEAVRPVPPVPPVQHLAIRRLQHQHVR
jgi:hypothetical protein